MESVLIKNYVFLKIVFNCFILYKHNNKHTQITPNYVVYCNICWFELSLSSTYVYSFRVLHVDGPKTHTSHSRNERKDGEILEHFALVQTDKTPSCQVWKDSFWTPNYRLVHLYTTYVSLLNNRLLIHIKTPNAVSVK